jgi:2-polyprenyl-6-hydroxyphenyl methylase/3-demethylubiquinone-9 3-methyltransferase
MPTAERTIEQLEYDKRWGNPDEGYGAGQPGYAPHFVKFMNAWVSKMPADRRKALDIGCGDGYFTGQLKKAGCEPTGLDFSLVGLSTAARLGGGASFVEHDLTKPLPFADSSLDIAWCSEVLEHLFSPLYVMQQVRRILRPGGLFLVTVPYHGLLKNLAIAMFAFEKHYDPEYPHLRFFTAKSLTGLLTKAGFKIEWQGSCGSGLGVRDVLFPTNLLVAARKPPLPAGAAA